MSIEYVPGNTFFHKLDSRSKLCFFLLIVVLAGFIQDPFFLALVLFGNVLVSLLARIPFEKMASLLKALVPICILYYVLNFFFPLPQPAELVQKQYTILSYAINLAQVMGPTISVLKFLSFVTGVRLVTFLTRIDDMISALTKWKLPPEFAIAISMTFASIPLFINSVRTIMEAQMARALNLGYRNPIKKMFSYFPLVLPTVMLCFRRSMSVAAAIELRGFSYNIAKRTYRKKVEFKMMDYAFVIFCLIMGIIVLILRFYFGYLQQTFTLSFLEKMMS